MYGIFIIILGLIVGSFLGLIIDRLPIGKSIVMGRSRCEFCDRDLNPLELIPVLSYFFQGGRCKNCDTNLSLRYPLIEILTAVAFYFSYLKFDVAIELVFSLLFTSVLIVIAFIDLDTMIIYDRFHIMILILGVLEALLLKKNFLHLIIASFLISLPFLIIAIVTGGMGGGDIKLMFVSGFYLGITKILVAFVISVVLGGTYAVYTLIRKKHSRKDAIPFGPFLCVGLYVAMLYGAELSQWYLSFFS